MESLIRELRQKLIDQRDLKKQADRLFFFSDSIDLNLLDEIIIKDHPDLCYLLALRTHFNLNLSCRNIASLIAITTHITNLYPQLRFSPDSPMKSLGFYLNNRLFSAKNPGEKLEIISNLKMVPDYLRSELSNTANFELGKITEKFLLDPNILSLTASYKSKPVSVLALETLLRQKIEDRSGLIFQVFWNLKANIEDNLNTGGIQTDFIYSNAVSLMNIIEKYLIEFEDRIKLEYKTIKDRLLGVFPNPATSLNYHPSAGKSFESLIVSIEICKSELIDEGGYSIRPVQTIKGWEINIRRKLLDGLRVVTKTYKQLGPKISLDKIYNEIIAFQEASKIQERLNQETCFLKYYGTKVTKDSICLVMEEGGIDLMTLIGNSRKFSENELKTYFKQLVRSFYELRKIGILHRDIKPLNILINENNQIKIIDFNFCLIGARNDYDDFVSKAKGTSAYASPQVFQALNKDYGCKYLKHDPEKADVYSLGLVFLEMCLRRKVDQILEPGKYREFNGEVNSVSYDWARDLIRKMLVLDPSERASFEELYDIMRGDIAD